MKSYCKIDKNVQKEVNFKVFVVSLVFLIVGIVGVVSYIILGGFVFKTEPKWLNYMLWASSILFAFGLIYIIINFTTNKKSVAQNLADESEFFEDHLTLNSYKNGEQIGTAKVYYKDILKLKETKHYIFLYISAFQAVAVNKQDLTQEDISKLKLLVLEAKNKVKI